MQTECAKFGCKIEDTENDMFICGGFAQPTETLNGWKDHRIVMALAIALSRLGGEICGCEAVSKSYPSFFEDLKKAGIDVQLIEE